MRTKNFFRTIVAATLCAIISTSANAQYVSAAVSTHQADYDATLTTSDYATIGSRMPYYVEADQNVVALVTAGTMNQSQFKWEFFDHTPTILATQPVLKAWAGGAALAPASGGATYYAANELSVTWAPASVSAGTEYEIHVTEHSVPASGVFAEGCADATPEVRNIFILNRPTLTKTALYNSAACGIIPNHGGAEPTLYAPVDVTGMGTFNITYSVTLNGTIVVPATEIPGFGAGQADDDVNIVSIASTPRHLLGSWANGNSVGATGLPVKLMDTYNNGGYGKYVVSVTNINDMISRKSLDVITSQAGDVPAVDYYFYVIPTPVTGKIQHRTNNAGW